MAEVTLTRRAALHGAAGVAAGAMLARTAPAAAHGSGAWPVPPEPIPGGIELGPGQVIHVWAPGPPEVTLPFTGATLQGLDVEPTTIKDFDGFSAVAFHVGTATARDGTRFDLETDLRAFRGTYLDLMGRRRFGTFGFI
jgi:hypothetical protein